MSTFENTLRFFNEAHNIAQFSYPEMTEESLQLQDDMRTMYTMQIQENLFIDKHYEGGSLGVSQLGKPAICTAWDYFYGRNSSAVAWSMKRKWLGGHAFELWVYYLLRRAGLEVEHQASVSVDANIPNGHPDFVCTDADGNKFVVECKHVSPANYKQYAKSMTNEQYITQLGLYCHGLDCDGMWIVGNTDTGECMAIPFSSLQRTANQHLVDRALIIASTLNSCLTFEEALKFIKLPPYRVTKDGRAYPPPTMYVSKAVLHPAAQLWKIETTHDGKYSIVGFNYPEDAKQYEPQWES